MQERVQTGSGNVAVDREVPRPVEEGTGAQAKRRALAQIMPRGPIRRHAGRLGCPIPLGVEQG
ncbi:hypothetical protein CTI14_01225 [Methylobacterium radiotolerans]|nr:hypothetical protein CTI14_01225 [Methylobacterium radiotolerans]